MEEITAFRYFLHSFLPEMHSCRSYHQIILKILQLYKDIEIHMWEEKNLVLLLSSELTEACMFSTDSSF